MSNKNTLITRKIFQHVPKSRLVILRESYQEVIWKLDDAEIRVKQLKEKIEWLRQQIDEEEAKLPKPSI